MLGFAMPRKQPLFAVCTLLCASLPCVAQNAPPAQPVPTIQERIEKMMDSTSGAWTPEQLATMARLRDAAMQDPYALKELRYLTDNIGPRLSGSPQAQKAVEYMAGEIRA